MGLFDKKICDICGGSMGLITDNKASDGGFCHTCAGKLSPFFHGARNATLQQIREQIAYRETNRQQLNIFNPTQVLGYNTKVYLDPGHNCFVVSKKSDYRAENADIINLSQVLGAVSEVKEHKTEIYQKDSQGHNVSYNPKRYDYKYEIVVTININSPYFNKIEFEVTKDRPHSRTSPDFMTYQQTADQIVAAVTGRPIANNAVGGVMGNVAGIAGTAGVVGMVGSLLGNQNNQQGGGVAGMVGSLLGNQNNQQGGGVAGMVGSLLGNQGNQQGMNNGFAQQGMNNGYAQQGMNNGYAQQGMNNGYAQQGANTAFGQQGMNNVYAQQGFNQPNFNGGAFGGQWQCPNCGAVNTANFCQMCGAQRR